jgi:DNA-binding ferritin-like protein
MKEISDSLGMVPLPENETTTLTRVPASDSKVENADKDYEYARENFYNVIEKGTYALEEMLEVAKASEHPRAYEVVSTIMKTLVDANKDLVTMSDKKVKDAPQEEQTQGTVNNNLFVGSTNELQKVLKDIRKDES